MPSKNLQLLLDCSCSYNPEKSWEVLISSLNNLNIFLLTTQWKLLKIHCYTKLIYTTQQETHIGYLVFTDIGKTWCPAWALCHYHNHFKTQEEPRNVAWQLGPVRYLDSWAQVMANKYLHFPKTVIKMHISWYVSEIINKKCVIMSKGLWFQTNFFFKLKLISIDWSGEKSFYLRSNPLAWLNFVLFCLF